MSLPRTVERSRRRPCSRARAPAAGRAPTARRRPARATERIAAVADVRRGRGLGQEDHVRPVLAHRLADDVLDVAQVGVDLAEPDRQLDGDDLPRSHPRRPRPPRRLERVGVGATARRLGLAAGARPVEVRALARPDAGRPERLADLLAPDVLVDPQFLADLGQQRAAVGAALAASPSRRHLRADAAGSARGAAARCGRTSATPGAAWCALQSRARSSPGRWGEKIRDSRLPQW